MRSPSLPFPFFPLPQNRNALVRQLKSNFLSNAAEYLIMYLRLTLERERLTPRIFLEIRLFVTYLVDYYDIGEYL